jgi:hypothetical protein
VSGDSISVACCCAAAAGSGTDSGIFCSVILEISGGRVLSRGGRGLRGRDVEAGRAALGCSGCSVGCVVSSFGIMFLRLSLPVIL